jgi:drug/metabolite transporter (DMT)-like permease
VNDKKFSIGAFVLLQVALFILSFGAVCSKMAGRQEFLSIPFFAFYGTLILILFVYAILWQQVLKRISLVVAYACKGIGIIYGILWGVLFFKEEITWKMIVGAVLVLIGVYIFVFGEIKANKKTQKPEENKQNA